MAATVRPATVGEAEAIQNARSIGTDLDASTYFGQLSRLFIYVRVDAHA